MTSAFYVPNVSSFSRWHLVNENSLQGFFSNFNHGILPKEMEPSSVFHFDARNFINFFQYNLLGFFYIDGMHVHCLHK